MERVALIPSFQPTGVLTALAEQFRKEGFEVVIVDDGSGEEYAGIFESCKAWATVVSYPKNGGKGHALKVGFSYIHENYPQSIVVTVDGDGQHLCEDAKKICEEVQKNPDCFVVGSRKLPKSAPLRSRVGNGITRQMYRMATGIPVYDTQSGLRAFSSELLPQMISVEGERYEYEMNVLLYLAKEKRKVLELPITVVYMDSKNSSSHFSAVADSVRIYFEIIKYAGCSFLSFLVDYTMYALFLLIFRKYGRRLLLANYLARAVSSVFNFTLNKRFVFQSKGNPVWETVKYFSLVIVNININSLLLNGLVDVGVNRYPAKIAVEFVMCVLGFFVQRFFIFRHKNEKNGRE